MNLLQPLTTEFWLETCTNSGIKHVCRFQPSIETLQWIKRIIFSVDHFLFQQTLYEFELYYWINSIQYSGIQIKKWMFFKANKYPLQSRSVQERYTISHLADLILKLDNDTYILWPVKELPLLYLCQNNDHTWKSWKGMKRIQETETNVNPIYQYFFVYKLENYQLSRQFKVINVKLGSFCQYI